jgi:hypothetical protein
MVGLQGDNMSYFFKYLLKTISKKLDAVLALLPLNGGKMYLGLAITVLAAVQVLVGGFDPTLAALVGDLIEQLKKLQDLTVLDAGVVLAVVGAIHKVIKAIRAYLR